MPRQGQAHEPEVREQISESLSNRKLTKAHRKHLSESKRKAFLEREKNNDYHLPQTRVCKICKKRKSSDEFRHEQRKIKSGIVRTYLRSVCKSCESDQNKKTSKAWRDRKRESGELEDLYRKYESNRSEESKENQRRLNRENDAIKRRDRGMKPRKGHKPVDAEVKVDRMPLVRFIEAEMKRTGVTIDQISRRAQVGRHSAVSYIMQGWEPTSKNRTGRTLLNWISLKRVDQILTGLDKEEELTILYPQEVIDAGVTTQTQEKAEKAAASKRRRRAKQKARRKSKREEKERGETGHPQTQTQPHGRAA